MGRRHTGRKLAMQILFQADVQCPEDMEISTLISNYLDLGKYHPETREWAAQLARDAWCEKDKNDALIQQYLKSWDIKRINRVDLSLLRLALYEISDLKTPHHIAIDEALELAKKYGTDESAKFVNGVLGNYVKDNPCLQDLSN